METYGGPNAVTVDTAHRFKGLEAAIVFLWGLDGFDPQSHKQTMYVGLSRAKSRLFLVGTDTTCKAVGG